MYFTQKTIDFRLGRCFFDTRMEKIVMATPRQLVEVMAEVLNVSAATVIVHDRNLATAVLRTMAGRGRAAAAITADDAANLLIAVAASQSVKDSAPTVIHFRKLKILNSIFSRIERYDKLPASHTFGHALFTLIEAAAAEEIEPECRIRIAFLGPLPSAIIEIEYKGIVSIATYVMTSRKGGIEQHNRLVVGDLQRMTTVTQNTIFCLGKAVGDNS
jgi:hypothetical protein